MQLHRPLSQLFLLALTFAVLPTHAAPFKPSVGPALPDTPFEQVVADRYLFSPFAEECTAWPVLNELINATIVQSAPWWHTQATDGAFVYGLTNNSSGSYALYWFDVTAGNLTAVLTDMPDCATLLVTQGAALSDDFTGILLCPNPSMGQTILYSFVCSPFDITQCSIKWTDFSIPGLASSGVIVESIPDGILYIGTNLGVVTIDLTSQEMVSNVNNITDSITAVTWSSNHNVVFMGSAYNLFFQDLNANVWRTEEVTALIDSPITSLTYDVAGDHLWIGQLTGITLYSPITMPDGELHWLFTRLAGFISDPGSDIGGLPYANITALAYPNSALGISDSRVWLGSQHGLMRFDVNAEDKRDQWRVFNSARYMPQRDAYVNVSSLTILNSGTVGLGNTAIAITAKGISVIYFQLMTLAEKAAYMQTYMDKPGRHERYGLTADCNTPVWGDASQCMKGPNDNDGLWTSIYLSSQIWRSAVMQDPAIWNATWATYEAMKFQQTITGIYGYPARSVAMRSEFPPGNGWFLSPTFDQWQFKGDTSSDEITGHGFIYPLVADLLAENPEQQTEAMYTGLNITNNIITNNLYLVGETGQHTTWGVWNPEFINLNPLWQEGRGPNSLQILSWLIAGAALDPTNTTYMNVMEELFQEPIRYDVNILNGKMIAVCDSNFSDDELNYLSYFTMRHGLNTLQARLAQMKKTGAITSAVYKKYMALSTQLEAYMSVGLDMAQRYKVREQSPWYNSLYCYASGQVGGAAGSEKLLKTFRAERKAKKMGKTTATKTKPTKKAASTTASSKTNKRVPVPTPNTPEFDCTSLSQDSIWYLRRWPLEQFGWPQFNSDRLDIELNNPAFGCRAGVQSIQLLPPDERLVIKWNQGPFELDQGDGHNEEGVGPFLSSYWMMKYYGMIQ